jgi:hypothetical protein
MHLELLQESSISAIAGKPLNLESTPLRVSARTPCDRVRDRALAKLADIDGRIAELQAMRDALARLARTAARSTRAERAHSSTSWRAHSMARSRRPPIAATERGMKIQLLHLNGCPNLEPARAALREAVGADRLDASIDEIDVEASDAPQWARGWGSPTVPDRRQGAYRRDAPQWFIVSPVPRRRAGSRRDPRSPGGSST